MIEVEFPVEFESVLFDEVVELVSLDDRDEF